MADNRIFPLKAAVKLHREELEVLSSRMVQNKQERVWLVNAKSAANKLMQEAEEQLSELRKGKRAR